MRASSPVSITTTDLPWPTTAASLLLVPVGSVVVNAIEVCETLELGAEAVAPDPAELINAELITDPTEVVAV
jgi:hypothetical protein